MVTAAAKNIWWSYRCEFESRCGTSGPVLGMRPIDQGPVSQQVWYVKEFSLLKALAISAKNRSKFAAVSPVMVTAIGYLAGRLRCQSLSRHQTSISRKYMFHSNWTPLLADRFMLWIVLFTLSGNGAHGGCDHSIGYAYSHSAPDPTSVISRISCS
jgi:hypothetical protein